jgi:hypothetical protein
MIPNALLPDYRECGSPGEEKKADGEKRGRRRRLSKLDPDAVGINVDEGTKKIIEMSKKLFYDTKEKNPERRAYKLMIERFYTIGG